MARFNEQDRTLLYIVRTTARQLERGSWADCVAIYNRLASRPRTQDGLSNTYHSLDRAEMERRSRSAEWEATRERVKKWLHDASQVCRRWASEANWQSRNVDLERASHPNTTNRWRMQKLRVRLPCRLISFH